MTVTHDIVAKLWNLCNVLQDDGVTYHQYVTELTYLLFLKMAQETGTEDQQRKYRCSTFYGMEHVQDTHRLALMNLMSTASSPTPSRGASATAIP